MNPLKLGSELRCSGMESSSCFTSGTRYVSRFQNLMTRHEKKKNGRDCDNDKRNISVIICDTELPVSQVMMATVKTFEVMTST